MPYICPNPATSASNSGAQSPTGNGTQAPQNTPAGGNSPANHSNAQSPPRAGTQAPRNTPTFGNSPASSSDAQSPPPADPQTLQGTPDGNRFDGVTANGDGWAYGHVTRVFTNPPCDLNHHHVHIERRNGGDSVTLMGQAALNAFNTAGPWAHGLGLKLTFVGSSETVRRVVPWDRVLPPGMT